MIKPIDERQRIRRILNCEEARGREAFARTLALSTNSSVALARKLLAAAPTDRAAEVARILAFVPPSRLRAQRAG